MPDVDRYYRNVPMRQCALSAEDEAALFNSYRGRHSKKLREKIVKQYLYWAAELACRYCGPRFSKEEAISAANYGLMQAIEDYDPSCGRRFVWRSFLAIRRAIIDAMRTESYVVNPYPQLNAHKYVYQKTGRTKAGKIKLQADRAKVFQTVNTVKTLEPAEVEDAFDDREGLDTVDSIERTQMLEFLKSRLGDLEPHERKIIELRYFGVDTMIFRKIGVRLKMKKAYVQYTHDRAIEKLRRTLKKEL